MRVIAARSRPTYWPPVREPTVIHLWQNGGVQPPTPVAYVICAVGATILRQDEERNAPPRAPLRFTRAGTMIELGRIGSRR